MPQSLKSTLRAAALQCGAVAVGFARCEPVGKDAVAAFDGWISAGNHGEMAYMANHTHIRRNPELLLPGARTIMVCAFPYYHPDSPSGVQFAMYAHGTDYHLALRRLLKPVAEVLEKEGYSHRICVDSAPIIERYWAQQSGVGFIGRNGLIIVPQHGSFVFLSEILTDAEIEPDEPCKHSCLMCMECVKSCPGGALRADNGFDARHCLSYLTIEYRGELPHALHGTPISRLLGRCVYGCDTCQQVCPHNASVVPTPIEEFHLRPRLRHLTRADILAMDADSFADAFRHSAIKRIKLDGLKRNAAAMRDD